MAPPLAARAGRGRSSLGKVPAAAAAAAAAAVAGPSCGVGGSSGKMISKGAADMQTLLKLGFSEVRLSILSCLSVRPSVCRSFLSILSHFLLLLFLHRVQLSEQVS